MSRSVPRSLAAWTIVFAALSWPWVRVATHAAPTGYLPNPPDEWLVPWILAWVAHALATAPLHVLDANIGHPAPAQLAGIEHFASTQPAFAPVFWATGNAILATNVVTLVSYPLAALAMERLLRALGLVPSAAAVGGLLFALGPLRVPGNFMVMKYLNVHLALVALALTRLRERATVGRAALVAGATGAALFSSYYLAVMALLAAGIWTAAELVRPAPGRLRFALGVALAIGAAVVVLAAASGPYLARPEAATRDAPATSPMALAFYTIPGRAYLQSGGWFPGVLAALGAIGLGSAPPARRAAGRGLVVVLVAHVLMAGPAKLLHDVLVPLPYAAFATSPLRFFRAPARFVVLLGFGTALLGASAVDVAVRRLGRVAGGVVVAVVAAIVVVTRGMPLVGPGFEEFTPQHAPIYGRVRDVAQREGGGALLELPTIPGNFDRRRFPHGTEVETMLGSTRHWLPLVTGCHGCYPAPHGALVSDAISRLPATDALDDLVDLTHVRWVLLRPADDWARAGIGAQRRAYLTLAGVTSVASADGWDLLRIERTVRHPEWFAAIAAGWRPGRTVLGTPLAPLAASSVASRIDAPGAPGAVLAGWPLRLELVVANRGRAAWPVALPPAARAPYVVALEARWRPHADGVPSRVVARQGLSLWRDVAPGDDVRQAVILATPTTPGTYDVEIGLRQDEGVSFDERANPPLVLRVAVAPPAGAGR